MSRICKAIRFVETTGPFMYFSTIKPRANRFLQFAMFCGVTLCHHSEESVQYLLLRRKVHFYLKAIY